jgi:hypothetical protein
VSGDHIRFASTAVLSARERVLARHTIIKITIKTTIPQRVSSLIPRLNRVTIEPIVRLFITTLPVSYNASTGKVDVFSEKNTRCD